MQFATSGQYYGTFDFDVEFASGKSLDTFTFPDELDFSNGVATKGIIPFLHVRSPSNTMSSMATTVCNPNNRIAWMTICKNDQPI